MGKILIAGGTGLIGSALKAELVARGNEVWLLSRTPGEGRLEWDGVHSGEWAEQLADCQAVVNLAGSPISVKFSVENRRTILKSRLDPTGAIGNAIQTVCLKVPPPHWINASAVGFYGDRGNEICTEKSENGSGFLAKTCLQWEQACLAHPSNCLKSIVRIGVVMADDGGAYPKLRSVTNAFLGGQLGNGKQWMSWISLGDLINLFCWLIEGKREGIFNGTAPDPCTNRDFMESLRRSLGRPWSPPAPEFAIRLMGATVGPDSSVLLDSTRAVPEAALAGGFKFQYESLDEVLRELSMK